MRREEELYMTYAPMVYKYLLCLTHDKPLAEDLTSETFEKAIRSIEKFRGDCKLSVWLCAIAKRLYYMEMRRRGDVVHIPLENEALVSSQDMERDYIRKESRLQLYRELQELPPETREVFYLRMAGEMTFEEIGDILGKSGNWARVTFYRGKERLKRRMQHDGQ